MNKVIITTVLTVFSITFCQAQIQDALREQQKREAQQQQAAKEQKERERNQIQQERERLYQEAVNAAERNFNQQQYEQAKQDYISARKLKPENATYINQKIAEIDKIFRDRAALYQSTIESAERKFSQQQYEQAKQDYITERGYKPENAASINAKIAEIDEILLEKERETRYQNLITSAERNFNQRKYAQAKQDYQEAIKIKPENAYFINLKLAEIEKKMNEPATLYVYRKRKFDIFPKKYDIFLDDKVVGNSSNNWKTNATVSTFGTQTVSATIENRKAEVRINFEPGGVYYVRSDISSRSVGTGKYTTKTDSKTGRTYSEEVTRIEYTPILQLVDRNVGESEFNAIKDK